MRTEIAIISALTLVLSMPLAFGEIVETKGQNYDLVENFFIGEAVWESHPERIMDGGWQNYALSNTGDKVIFNTNAVGSFIFDKNSCSYSIYGNGFDGEQIIPSVSAVATYLNNGQWQTLPINDEACTVTVDRYENGVFLTSTKVITEDITEDVFISYTGTTENFYVNATNANFDLIQSSNGTNIGYFNGETRVLESVEVEKFVQELRLDINSGFKETFKIWHDGSEELGISQTVHTGESITIGEQTINIAELNGQSFDRQFIIDNQAEILAITDSVNYDFDTGIESLSNVNIIFDSTSTIPYKVNMDFADGGFVGYLEIDPTVTIGASTSAYHYDGNNNGLCDVYYATQINNSFYAGMIGSASVYDCYVSDFAFDISSVSTDAINDIASVTLELQTGTSFAPESIDIVSIDFDDLGSRTNAQRFSSILSGTEYVNSYTMTSSTLESFDLTSAISSDLSSAIGTDTYFSFGVRGNDLTQTGNSEWTQFDSHTGTNPPSLEIVYPIPIAPQPPTGLTTVTGVPVELDWTAPTDNGGSAITGYKVFRTLNEYALSELPDNSANSAGIDFTDNEFLLHGFEDTQVRDSTLDGTNTGATTGQTGKINNAWDFSASDYATISDDERLRGLSEMSLNFWVKANSYSGVDFITSGTGAENFKVRMGSTGDVFFYTDGIGNRVDSPVGSISTSTFKMITIVYDGSGSTNTDKVKIYVDNVLSSYNGNGAIVTSIPNNVKDIILAGDGADIILDEFVFYDKALTSTEVSALYNGGSGDSTPDTDGLVAHYNFEQTGTTLENQGTTTTSTVVDKSTNSISITGSSFYLGGNTPTTENDNGVNEQVMSSANFEFIGEKIQSTSSALHGVETNKMGLMMKMREGSPTGIATVGVMDSSANFLYQFGTIDVSTLPTTYTWIYFENPQETYTLSSGERIGIKYTGGDTNNRIGVYWDNNGNYDGANSDGSEESGGAWNDRAGQDLRFKIFPVTISTAIQSTSTTGVIGTGIQTPQLSFTDSNLPDNTDDFSVGSWVKLDTTTQTVTFSGSQVSSRYIEDKDNNNVCDPSGNYYDYVNQGYMTRLRSTPQSEDCAYSGFEFDISSIPDGSTVTDSKFKFEINSVSNPRSCDFIGMDIRPSTATADQVFRSIHENGMTGTELVASDSVCTTTGTNKVVDLGSAGNTYFTNQLVSDDWAGIGVRYDNMALDSNVRYTGHNVAGTPVPTLELTYTETVPPTNTKLLGLNDVTFNVEPTSASVDELSIGTVTNADVVFDSSSLVGTITYSGNQVTDSHSTWSDVIKSTSTLDVTNGGELVVDISSFPSTSQIIFGFGQDPLITTSYAYDDIEYSLYLIGDGRIYKVESGVFTQLASSGGGTGTYKITMDTNGVVKYYKGSTLYGTSSQTASGTYYFETIPHGASTSTYTYTGLGQVSNTIISASGLTDNTSTPQHYTFTRSANDWTIYQNGASEATATDSTSLGANTGVDYTTHIDGMIDEYFINSDSLTSTEVDMAYDKGSSPTQIATTGSTTTDYDDSNVIGGNEYYYTVKATNAIGDSDFLTPFVSALAGTPPDVPTSVSSTINSPNTAPLDITVSWSAPTNVGTGTLTGFEIYRDSTLITTTGLVTSYTDTVPSGGGTFEYKLKAVSTHGASGFSATTSTTTPTVPPAPTNAPSLAINNPNPSPLDIEVSWTEPASGGSIIQSYEVFRSADDITFTSVGTVTDLDFTDTVPSAGTWYYKFTSINLVGSSGLSPSNSITTASVPSSPLNASSVIPSINSAPYDVTVSWDLPTSTGGSALTGYNVYRQTGTGAFSLITTTTALGYVDTVPTALNQDYTFKIHAVNNVGESTGFTTTTITTGDVPDAPVLSFTTGTTALSWTVPSSDASITGYEIFRDGSSLTTVTTTSHSDFTPINFGQSYQYEVQAVSSLGNSASSNSIVTTPETEITGMIVQGITGTGAVIDWNEPAYYQGQITSYSVYYATPATSANPTISAGTTTNTYSNFAPTLEYDTSYTFGVTINSPLGNSGFSNLVNATTGVDNSIVAYDPNTGDMNWFDIDSVSEQTVNVIEFQRETQNLNVNGTFTDVDTLQVGYPSWWDDMTCDIDYKFAQKTEQYVEGTDMTAVVNSADANQQVIGFQFHDIDNEVIEVECAPQQSQQDDGVSAKYIMTQTNLSTGVPNIPLVAQIQAFQTGDYGTDGEFGALDIVGLFVILISMVGFNRLNPIVGVLLSASLVFGLSFFGIISLPTVLVGVVALVIFLAWGITRNR